MFQTSVYEPKHCEVVIGSLLDSAADYIVHQTNCMSSGQAAGIARVIFDKFPWANSYIRRVGKRMPLRHQMPGDIEVFGTPGSERKVINLYGQFYPGGPSDDIDEVDHPDNRREWFALGLDKIAHSGILHDGETIACPWQIGCGIAGGDWHGVYYPMLDRFAAIVALNGVKTFVYRLPGE